MQNVEHEKTFSMAQVRAIKADLAKLKPANPVRADGKLTIKGAIMQLAPILARKKAQGFTNAELVAELQKKAFL